MIASARLLWQRPRMLIRVRYRLSLTACRARRARADTTCKMKPALRRNSVECSCRELAPDDCFAQRTQRRRSPTWRRTA